jgi:hypothetical protein
MDILSQFRIQVAGGSFIYVTAARRSPFQKGNRYSFIMVLYNGHFPLETSAGSGVTVAVV